MKKTILKMALVLSLLLPAQLSHADMFGADVGVLTQILAQTIEELAQLKMILQNGQDTLGLLQDVNRGINDSLQIIQTVAPNIDPGLFGNLQKVQDVLGHLSSIYGTVADSPEGKVQSETDEVVAEAISMNNGLYRYADQLDKVGEQVKAYSHDVSPGGAAKLTAQTLGVLIHVMNQQLRATATGLKLSAQEIAIKNRKEKEQTAEFLKQANTLSQDMKANDVPFEFPRF